MDEARSLERGDAEDAGDNVGADTTDLDSTFESITVCANGLCCADVLGIVTVGAAATFTFSEPVVETISLGMVNSCAVNGTEITSAFRFSTGEADALRVMAAGCEALRGKRTRLVGSIGSGGSLSVRVVKGRL